MAEGLELVIPGLAEGEPELAVQLKCVRTGDLHRVAHSVFGDHNVASGVGLGEEDAKVGRMHPAPAVTTGRRVLGDLKAQVLPASQGGGDGGTSALSTLPIELGAHGALEYALFFPLEVHGAVDGSPCSPLDVRAQRSRRRVHEKDTPRHCDTGLG